MARIFNTFGPRMQPNDGRVVSNFIVQALLGRDITIYGDGSQTRSFCYVDDHDRWAAHLMASAESVTGPINIGNPAEFSILELAKPIIDLTGSASHIVIGRCRRTTRGNGGPTYRWRRNSFPGRRRSR